MEDIEKLQHDAYYMNPAMIKFLLVENLALKALLHKSGALDPEFFKVCKKEAEQVLDEKYKSQMQKWSQANNDLMGRLLSISPQNEAPLQTKDDAAVVSTLSSICQVQPQLAQ